jgi:hypothetical protein
MSQFVRSLARPGINQAKSLIASTLFAIQFSCNETMSIPQPFQRIAIEGGASFGCQTDFSHLTSTSSVLHSNG